MPSPLLLRAIPPTLPLDSSFLDIDPILTIQPAEPTFLEKLTTNLDTHTKTKLIASISREKHASNGMEWEPSLLAVDDGGRDGGGDETIVATPRSDPRRGDGTADDGGIDAGRDPRRGDGTTRDGPILARKPLRRRTSNELSSSLTSSLNSLREDREVMDVKWAPSVLGDDDSDSDGDGSAFVTGDHRRHDVVGSSVVKAGGGRRNGSLDHNGSVVAAEKKKTREDCNYPREHLETATAEAPLRLHQRRESRGQNEHILSSTSARGRISGLR